LADKIEQRIAEMKSGDYVAPEVQAEKSVEAKFKSGDKISFTIDGESATAVVDYVEGDGDIYGRFDDDILEAHGHFINAGAQRRSNHRTSRAAV